MRKILLIVVCLVLGTANIHAQCVVKEAIRNGDFNDGYIPGDFDSDLSYAQADIDARLASNQCFYQTGGRYYVSDNNQIYTCEGTAKQGTSFTPDFTTYGIDGSSDKILFVDPSTGSPEIFGQTVNVFPNQTYYFSFWFNAINPPNPFFGATIDGQQVPLTPTNSVSFVTDLVRVRLNPDGTRIEGPNGETIRDTTSTTVQWVQYSGSWTSGTNTTVDVELKPYANAALTQGVPLSGVDFALDKFSLINSCQNVYGANAYVIDFDEPDTVNLCEIGGEITLDPNVPGGEQNNATITWFEGDGNNPTQIDAGVFTKTITSPGYYSVCVDDPDNACNQVENILVIEDVDLQVNDIELCSPAQMELDAGLDPNAAISIDWSGPSGSGSGRTYTATTDGSHNVSLTPLKGNTGCAVNKNFNVVSLLPEVDTIDYCTGGGIDVPLLVSDGNDYKWSLNQDMSNPIGIGSSVNYSIPNGSTGFIEVWVQNAETSPLGTMSGPAIGSSSSATATMTTSITTYQNILIKSARMGAEAWTGGCGGSGGTDNVTVELLDVANGNAVVSSTVVQVPCGSPGNVDLNINVPAGRYRLRTSGGGNMMTTPIWSGAAPTYSIGGVIDIDSYSLHVGAFGAMVIEASDACDPVPFVLRPISCCTAPTDDPAIDVPSSTLEVCAPDLGEVHSEALTDGLDFRWEVSTDGLTGWQTFVGTADSGDISGGKAILPDVATEQWYRIVIAEDGNLNKTCVKISDSVQFISNLKPVLDSIGLTPFKNTYCEGEAHVLEAHVDGSAGYPVIYEWKLGGVGTDSVTDGITTPGTHDYRVVVDAKGCLDSMDIAIDVEAVETADVTDVQGPFCFNDLNATITYEAITTTGGTWSVQSTDNATIDASTGELTFVDSGMVRVYYQTPGACFGIDSVDISIEPAMEVGFETADTNFCKVDVTFPVRLTAASSVGGTWSTWDVTNSAGVGATTAGVFDATGLLPGDYIVKYAVNGFSAACSDSDSITVTINPLDTAIITNPPSLCASDAPYQLTLDLAYTTSGDWTDSTGANTYVTNGGVFDPNGLSDGSVMVIFTTDGACPGADTSYVTVTSQINYDLPDGNQTFCLNNNPDTVSINVNTGGGKFWTTSGEGISADSLFVVFSLYTTGGQVDSLYYGKAGQCGDTVGVELTLLDVDTAEIDSFPAVCFDTAPFAWTYSAETTLGGTWSGNGIDPVTGIFTPALAGPGIHTITYTTPGGCPTADQVDIVVRPRVMVSLDSLALAFCGTASAQSTSANIHLGFGRWEKSGTWPADWDAGLSYDNDSTLNFDPNAVTANTDSIFYMIDESAFVCGDTTTLRIGISAMEIADIDSVNAVCSEGAAFDFTVQGTQGGTWSGTGITDGALGTFDPVTAGVGVHTIRYQTPGVCFVWDSLTITVILQENLTLTGDQTYCGNASPGDIFADKTGGTFFGGWNVAALTVVDDSTRTFDPVLAGGTGIDSIMYGIAGQCGDTTSLVIAIDTVDIPDIDGANESAFCQTDAAAIVSLMAIATPGGTWEDLGGGNATITTAGLFDPTVGQGTYQVVYTTPGSCFAKDTHEISVVGQIIVDIDPVAIPVEYCNNHGEVDLTPFLLPTTSSNTGGWQITPNVVGGVKDNNKLVPSALTAGVYSLKYALGNPNGNCRDSDSVSITILPILDPTITPPSPDTVCISLGNVQFVNTGDAGGVWSIDNGGIVDAATGDMTLTADGTYNITYSLGTTCPVDSTVTLVVEEPNDPTITDPGMFCANDVLATLTAADPGGTWSGAGINGNQFDPGANGNAGGTITVTYAFTGHCPIDDTQDIIVNPVLDPTIGNKPTSDVCIADITYPFNTTGDPGGAWSSNNGAVVDPITGEVDLVGTIANNGGSPGVFNIIYTHPCNSADTAQIEITTPGDPSVTPMGPFCENLAVQSQITLPPTSSGTWSSTPVAGAINATTGDFDPATAGPGAHLIRYDLPGTCPAWDTTTVIIEDLPNWDIEIPNAQGCEPFTTAMIINSQGSLPAQSFWALTDSSTHQVTGATDSLIHTFMNDGNYSVGVSVVFDNGCLDSAYRSNAITVNPVPVADFDWSPKNTTVLEPFIQFEDLSIDADADGYVWDLGRSAGKVSPSPATSTDSDPFVTYGDPDSSSYWVTLTVDNNGCADTITKRIWILDNFTVYVPNAFTPDGDGLNDVFFPNGKNHDNIEGASQYEFMIFNRWGQLIWESATPYQPWDGTHGKTNNNVQQDVYVWKLNVWDNIESVLKTYYGRVSLLK